MSLFTRRPQRTRVPLVLIQRSLAPFSLHSFVDGATGKEVGGEIEMHQLQVGRGRSDGKAIGLTRADVLQNVFLFVRVSVCIQYTFENENGNGDLDVN
jgi:hypothetical protein